MAIETVMLLGPDFPTLGEIHVEALGAPLAVGISAGRFPKAYAHTEPNEDAVMAATDGIRHLLAVADGHNGSEAATALIIALADQAERILTADDPAEIITRLAIDTTRSATAGTTLTAVFVSPTRTVVVSAGDSAALEVTKRPRWLTSPTAFLPSEGPLQVVTTQPIDRLVLVTDGVTDFLGRNPKKAIRDTWDQDPATTATNLLDLAQAGAAGDNATTAVFGHFPG